MSFELPDPRRDEDEPRHQFQGIRSILSQEWPANKHKKTYRKLEAERAELEKRRTICGFCGKQSRLLDGPSGRAWFDAHECKPKPSHLRLVKS